MDSQQPIGNHNQVKWKYVFVYFLLAFLISFPFNSGFLTDSYTEFFRGSLFEECTYLPACLGPFIAGFILLRLNRHHLKTISFSGNSVFANLFIATAPLISFSIVGLNNNFGLQPNLFAFIFTLVNLIYAIGEESGWRGYLQDAARPLNPIVRFAIIGLLWSFWHCRFSTPFDYFVFPLIAIGSSFLIGKLTEDTKSYFVAAGLHCFIIILTNSGNFDHKKIIGAILTLTIWVITSHKRKNNFYGLYHSAYKSIR